MSVFYIFLVGKIPHCKKLNGTNSYSFYSWLKTEKKVIIAADVTQYKCCVWSLYDVVYHRQIARQPE